MSSSSSASVISGLSRIVSWYSPASSHAFPFMRTYVVDAGLSPTRTAASPGVIPLERSRRISPWSSARMVSPTAVPSMSLAGKIHRAGLADHHHLDLSGVLELALDLAGDLLGEHARLPVVDRVRGHHHAYLSPRLDRKHFFYARELARDLLQLGESLDVGLERLAARPRSRPGHGVRRLHDHADRRLVSDVVVMCRNAVNDRRVLAVLGGDFHAQLDVRAVVLVGEHFADVVQQSATLCELHVELQLGRDDPRQPGHFLRVLENVLAVRGAVAHPPYELHELRMHAFDAGFVHRLLARLEDRGVHLDAGLVHDLLDAPRVDPSVRDESLQRQATHLAAYGIEARHDYGVRRVVDDHVHPGRRFERANVATLAPNDPALHLVGGEGDGGHRSLGGGLGREPLDGKGEDLLGFFVRAPARLLLQVPREGGSLVARLILEPSQQLLLGLLGGQAGDLLEPGARFQLLGGERLIPILQHTATHLETAGTLFQCAEALLDELLMALDVAAPARRFLLEALARLHELFLGCEDDALTGFPQEPLGLRGGRTGRRLGRAALHPAPDRVECHSCGNSSTEKG